MAKKTVKTTKASPELDNLAKQVQTLISNEKKEREEPFNEEFDKERQRTFELLAEKLYFEDLPF